MRSRLRIPAVLLCLLLLSGCMFEEETLLRLPQPPKSFVLLQEQFNTILSAGAEYTAPVNGTQRNAIHFKDIDGDGLDEVISLFAFKKSDGAALRTYLHKRQEDHYTELGQIEGLGDSVDVVYFPRFAHGTKTGIVLGWRLGDNPVCGISVYVLENGKLSLLYNGEYTGIEVGDIDGDGDDEILILQGTSGPDTQGQAKLLRYESGEMITVSTQPVSVGFETPGRLRIANVEKNVRAVFIDSQVFGRGYMTDVLAFQNGVLSNLLYHEDAKQSIASYRVLPLYSNDINLDGVQEFPLSELMPGYSGLSNAELFWRTDWHRYFEGRLVKVFSSYFNVTDRWYMVLPNRIVKNITVERGHNSEQYRSIVFREWNSAEGMQGMPLWEIVRLSGPDRFSTLESEELSELARTYDTIYAFRIYGNPSIYNLSASEIRAHFEIIQSEWIYENWAGKSAQNTK